MANNLLGNIEESLSPLEKLEMNEGDKVVNEEMQASMGRMSLVARINNDFEAAETARYIAEDQWTKNTRAYRAEDSHSASKNGGNPEFRSSEEHKPYIRTTTVKTRAAYAQIMESLMQNTRFPLMIEPTPAPEGVPEYVTNDPSAEVQPESQMDFGLGYEGDGRELAPGASMEDPENMWKTENTQEGYATSQDYSQVSPAKRAAERMNKVILDQLEESNAHTELRKSVFEACLLGSGVMKGVLSEYKTSHRWKDGVYTPVQRKYPKVNSVSLWNLYVDPNATTIEEAEYVIERHRMNAKKLRELKLRPDFNSAAIDRCLAAGSNYTRRRFEHEIDEKETVIANNRRWEVNEYWGYVEKEEAEGAGLTIEGEIAQVNVWVCGDEILKIVANPFLPQRMPYFMFDYETDAYSLYGTGVPETMEDSQKMMNGFARLAVDNLALAGNLVFAVDETSLVPGQDMKIFPGKTFRVQGGQGAAQAVQGIKFPSTANENLQMFQEFRRQADESTGIPSVSHGQTGVTGVGRTSSGLNMILENASLSIKTSIRNIDDDLLQPLGKMLFYWNQQFNGENLPEGDFECVATGIRSYTKQEVKVQRLQTLLQLVQNPALAPMVKLPYIIRELVKGMDLDPNEVINDMDEARLYAEIIGMAGGAQQQQGAVPEESTQGTSGLQGTGAGNPEGINGQDTGPTA